MELDDLKNSWGDISSQVNKQQLTPKTIDEMTKQQYHSKLNRIATPELAGILVCIAGAVFITVKFCSLNTPFLQGTGIVSILLLLVLSAISFISIRRFTRPADLTKTYTETLRDFALQKIQFIKLQKINGTLSYLLLVMVIILMSKFINGKDLSANKYFWTFSFTIGYLFLLFYSKWVSKYYGKTLGQAEELLRELGE